LISAIAVKKNDFQYESDPENESINSGETFPIPSPSLILIVEDNAEMRFFLRHVLGTGIDIAEAGNGREALRWLNDHTPDLIISDVMMPHMDGYQFLSALKSSEQWRSIPVIMVTSRSSEQDLLHGLSLGVDDYIVKPFNEKELKIRIFNLLSNQRMRKEWLMKQVEKDNAPAIVEEPDDRTAFIEQVQKFVEERAAYSTLGITDLADHLAMSERQLYRKCGLITGLTPANLIKEIRLKIAYKMLLDKRVSKITELASMVGFENSAYFSRQFFERYGKKPVEFLT
jgi:DNA-binding response OmpR family regulator